MAAKKSFWGFFGGVLLTAVQMSFAQQEAKDQLFVVHEEIVKVDMLSQYEKTSKEWVDMMHEAGLDIPQVHASQRDDFHYYYSIPISNYAEIDGIFPKFQEAIKKVDKDKWAKFTSENDQAIKTLKEYVIKWSAALSYESKQPRLKQGEGKFLHWIFFHYKLSSRKEIMGVIKEWKKLYEDKNISHGYDIWLIEMGLDNNLIVLSEMAKDGRDYYQTIDEVNKKVEHEVQKLQAKFLPLVTEIENKYGWVRSDLSYYKK